MLGLNVLFVYIRSLSATVQGQEQSVCTIKVSSVVITNSNDRESIP
jgi:hypothetical protein